MDQGDVPVRSVENEVAAVAVHAVVAASHPQPRIHRLWRDDSACTREAENNNTHTAAGSSENDKISSLLLFFLSSF